MTPTSDYSFQTTEHLVPIRAFSTPCVCAFFLLFPTQLSLVSPPHTCFFSVCLAPVGHLGNVFDKLSGGLGGGLDPPAFQRAERERMKKTLSKESADELHDLVKASNGACKGQKEDLPASVPERDNVEHEITKDDSHRKDDTSAETHGESESLSDIDDQEVDGYLHNEKEKQYRKIIWENMNREFLEEQAAKEAAAAAAKKTFEAIASTTAEVAKSRKRRAHQAKHSGPAKSAAEAACQMAKKKRLSNRVNFDCLEKLFDKEPADPGNPKKVRFDLPSDDHDKFQSEVEGKKADDLGSADDFEDGDLDENNWYPENMNETYFPDDDGYNYDDDY